MKRILLLFSALMLSCIALWAHDVVIGGIYYNLNETKKTAEVTYYGDNYDDYDDEYSGSVTIPETITYNSETYSVTSIGLYAFYDCSGLTSVTIPNSVTSIHASAFSGCSGLTEVNIPNSVTSIGYSTFQYCSGLTEVTIPNSVTSIGQYAFDDCSGLTSVTIPNSVTSIGSFAFYDTGIYNNESNWDNGVLYIDNCIIEAKSDVVKGSYTIKKGTRIIGDHAFGWCRGLTSVTIPNSVTSIGSSAFSNCSGLTEVTIGESVTSIDEEAFSGCSGLTSVTIPNSVTSIGRHAFYNTGIYNNKSNWDNGVLYIDNCLIEATSDVVKGSYTIKKGTRIIGNGAFEYCSGLTSVTIPNSVTSIGYDAFYDCSGLTSVTIPNSVTSIGQYAFAGCSGLTSVTIPNSVTSIGQYAFAGCSGLTSVTIPNSVTSIGNGAFEYCSGLTSVTIPNSVTSIGYDAFHNCSGLTSVTIPNSVTSIGDGAFYGCSGLTEVSIGESVTSIGYWAFSGCDKLRKVTAYPTTVPNVYESSFAHYNAALYMPCDVYDDYFFDDVFGTFKATECIAAEEVDAPDKVEIEIDEDNNANVIWPSTDGAKTYKLEISKDGEVFCTLLFNENGQLTSIDFGNRSASVGFQFTVTGLDGASKYAYSMVAMDKKGNELQSYKGTFTTNGYVPGPGEEDEPSAIIETLADANITISGGTISADADFSIYNTIGQDVTAFNGSLQPGVYLVSIENNIVKVMVK